MNNFRIRICIIGLVGLLLFGCTTRNSKVIEQKHTVSVSILPQKYLVDRLTDSSFRINVMVPPGTSPEMYEPSPVQMKEVGNSVVYFAVGPLEFESTILPRIKELNPNIKFVNLSDGINLLEGHRHREIMGEEDHHHINYDPHIWTSTAEFKKMAENTCKVLCEVFPEKKELFQGNLSKLNQDIDNLDLRIKKMIENAKTKDFLIYHPALTYFSKEYGLNQIAIEEDGKNPSAQKLTVLLSLAKKEGINTVFIQSQFDSHNAEMVAMELGGEIVKIDPLGYDWLKNMNDMVDKLAVALKSK